MVCFRGAEAAAGCHTKRSKPEDETPTGKRTSCIRSELTGATHPWVEQNRLDGAKTIMEHTAICLCVRALCASHTKQNPPSKSWRRSTIPPEGDWTAVALLVLLSGVRGGGESGSSRLPLLPLPLLAAGAGLPGRPPPTAAAVVTSTAVFDSCAIFSPLSPSLTWRWAAAEQTQRTQTRRAGYTGTGVNSRAGWDPIVSRCWAWLFLLPRFLAGARGNETRADEHRWFHVNVPKLARKFPRSPNLCA